MIDDVHLLAPGSAGAIWLTALINALPTNGHVLLASRWSPAVPLARLATQGAVLGLAEDDLRFTDDELAGFAARRGIAVGRLDDTGGWPAMAELAASVGHERAGDYLWEDILEPLGPERRRVLAVLSDLGGADEGLAGAALGTPVDLADVLDGVPLVAHGADGWRVPHPLWRGVPALTLANDERVSIRRRAVDHLVAEHRYDTAVTLAREAGLIDVVPGILRAACIGADRPPGRQLERWLADLPEALRDTAGAALAAGVRAAVLAPADATEPLRTAIRRCREAGDPDGELGAVALLGEVAWWRETSGCWPGCSPGWSSSGPRVIPSPAPWPRWAKRSSPTSWAATTMCSPTSTPSSRGCSTTRGKRWPAGYAPPPWPAAAGPRSRSPSSMPFPRSPTRRSSSLSRAPTSRPAGRWARSTRWSPPCRRSPIGFEAAGVLQFVLVSLAEAAFVLAWVGDVEGAQTPRGAGPAHRGGC